MQQVSPALLNATTANQLARKDEEIASLKRQLEAKSSEVTQLERRLTLLQRGRNNTSESATETVDALRRQLELAAAESKRLQIELNGLRPNAKPAEPDRQLIDGLSAKEQEVTELEAKVRELETQLDKPRPEPPGLRKQLADAKEEMDRLDRTNRDSQDELNARREEVGHLTARVGELTRTLYWAVAAAVGALAVGSALTRKLWPKRVDRPLSVSVTPGAWAPKVKAPQLSRVPSFSVRAMLVSVRSKVRVAREPLVREIRAL